MKSHISYVNEISVKDEKIQQNQRGGNKNVNPFYETCRIRNTESTGGLNIYQLIGKNYNSREKLLYPRITDNTIKREGLSSTKN